jgi:hypothetical protein
MMNPPSNAGGNNNNDNNDNASQRTRIPLPRPLYELLASFPQPLPDAQVNALAQVYRQDNILNAFNDLLQANTHIATQNRMAYEAMLRSFQNDNGYNQEEEQGQGQEQDDDHGGQAVQQHNHNHPPNQNTDGHFPRPL